MEAAKVKKYENRLRDRLRELIERLEDIEDNQLGVDSNVVIQMELVWAGMRLNCIHLIFPFAAEPRLKGDSSKWAAFQQQSVVLLESIGVSKDYHAQT